MNNLIDSSAWIEYFRGNKKYSFILNLIITNTICTNDLILSELLPFIIHRKEFKLADLLSSITNYTLEIDWHEIRNIQLLNLKHGNNNIGISDIIIAQNCMQNGLKLSKRRFIHTRKRAERAFTLFMMRARRPRSILQTNSALNTQHSSLHSRRVDKTTLTKLITHDKHFEAMSRYIPLIQYD